MKDQSSLHQKVQELCDCYATTNPLKEMSIVKDDTDPEEAALKWLALTALHGVNSNAKEISISRSQEGSLKVDAIYRKSELPSPGSDVGRNIFEAVRAITHIEGDTGTLSLALGIRDSSLNLKVELKSENGAEKLSIAFPE